MTRRSCRSPDRAPRGRRARPARAPSIATPRRPDPWPPPPQCAPSRLPAGEARSSSASRKLASSPKRVKNAVQAIPLEDRSSRLPMSARTASSCPISASAAFARGGRFGRRASAVWAGGVSVRDAIDEVGVGQDGRVLKHRGGRFRLVRRQRRGSTCAALRGPCTKLPPAPGAPGPKDHRAARSSPAPLRRGGMRGRSE